LIHETERMRIDDKLRIAQAIKKATQR